MTISYSCSCCSSFSSPSKSWLCNLHSKVCGGEKEEVSELPSSEALQPLPREICGHIFTGRRQWSSNRETDRPSLDLGAPESLTALKFIPSLPFCTWRIFQALLQAQLEMQRAQVLPILRQLRSHLHVMCGWGVGHTVLPVLNSCAGSLSWRDTQSSLVLPKLEFFLWIKSCCSGMGVLLVWQKSLTQPTADEREL